MGLALVVALAASLVHVLAREVRESPYAGTGPWWQPPAWLVTALAVAGFATRGDAIARSTTGPGRTAPEDGQRRRTSIRGGVASDCPTTQ